ncbi:MAG: PrsW family intramembrane metalloprotease [Ktedonobacterales bacterium]
MTKEFCRHCGADIPDGAQSCAVCGARVDAATASDAAPEQGGQPQAVVPGLDSPANALEPMTPMTPMTPMQALEASAAQPTSPPPPPAPAPTPAPAPAQYAPYPGTPGVWAPSAYPQYAAYPAYPSAPGAYGAGYPAAGQPGQPGAAYPYYGGYPWPGYAPYPMAQPAPRRAPGETYALVIAWIVTVASGIAVLGGLLVTAIASLSAVSGSSDDLSFLGGIIGFSLAPIIGGGFGLWYGILGIRRKPSPRFNLPTAWIILGLTVLAIGGGVALWQFNYVEARAPGTAFGVLPLATLTGALPALAILAFTTQRLRNPSTRRHVWMSLFYGMTLAPLLAVVLELIASFIIVVIFHLSAQDAQSVLGQPTTGNASPQLIIAELLVLSVVAPLVEEGVKPLAALLAIRRLRTPGEAFLVGLAAGVGFDMLETIGYIGQAQADWVSVAIDRIGAGLLHGVGAGMGALAWYYFVNGAGVHYRWLRAIGCGLYAILQHSLFNALTFSDQILPTSVSAWLNQSYFLGNLPLQRADIIYLAVYGLILGVLIFMTRRLLGAKGMPERTPPAPQAPYWPAWPPAPYGSYGSYPAYAPAAPGGWRAPAPITTTQQPMGGAQ